MATTGSKAAKSDKTVTVKKTESVGKTVSPKAARIKDPEYLNPDGTLKGVTLSPATKTRGMLVALNIKTAGKNCITSYTVVDENFSKAYTKAVDKVAELYTVGKKTKAYQAIADSLYPFLKTKGLVLEQLDAYRVVPI